MEIGKRLSEQTRDLIKSLLSTDDLIKVAENSSMSFSTVKNMVYGTTTITVENHTVVDALLKKAFEVHEDKSNELKKMLPIMEGLKTEYGVFHQKFAN